MSLINFEDKEFIALATQRVNTAARDTLEKMIREFTTYDPAEPEKDGVCTKRIRDIILMKLGSSVFEAQMSHAVDTYIKLNIDRMVAEALAAKLAQALFGDLVKGGEGGGLIGSALSSIGSFFGLGGVRANGGPVAAGAAYLVGERGPELFVPQVQGRIEPNATVSAATSITVNVQAVQGMSRATAQQQGEQIERGIRLAMLRNG